MLLAVAGTYLLEASCGWEPQGLCLFRAFLGGFGRSRFLFLARQFALGFLHQLRYFLGFRRARLRCSAHSRATFPAAAPIAFAAVTSMLSSPVPGFVSGVAAVFFGMFSVLFPSSWRPPSCCARWRSPRQPCGRFLCVAPASKPSRAASRPGSPTPSRSRKRLALSHH